MKKKPIPPRELLYELYGVQGQSQITLGKRFQVKDETIRKWLVGYDIPCRPGGRRHIIGPTKKQLHNLYVTKGMTTKEIGNLYDVTANAVLIWLKKHQIQSRSRKFEIPSKEYLHDLHINQKIKFIEIADILGVDHTTISNWFKFHGIENVTPFFGGSISKPEKELSEYITSLGFITKKSRIRNDKKRYELDIFVPEKSLAIEYCGLYFHRENARADGRRRHLTKLRICQERNIRLLTIFEDEWLEKPEIVKSIIASRLGIYQQVISARKCMIVINHPEVRTFLRENHLQGSPNSITTSVSLLYADKIIGTISFGQHHRKNDLLVLNRLCFAQHTAISGGTERLIRTITKMNIGPFITWSDNRWSDGSVYRRMGLIKDRELDIDYWWCKGQKRRSKQSMKKTKECPKNMTETEWRHSQGWFRIFDCGKIRWSSPK